MNTREHAKKHQEFMDEWNKKYDNMRKEELRKQGIIIKENTETKKDNFYGDCDSIYTMDNTAATIWYVIIMVVGSIFNDRILIWIFATVTWFNFITRHWK